MTNLGLPAPVDDNGDFTITLYKGNRILPRIRLHPTLAFYIIAQLILFMTVFGLASVAIILVTVFLHEMGHVGAARLVGGHTDEVVLWPLGGLGMSWYERTFMNKVVVTMSGLIVNGILFGIWFLAGGADFKNWEINENEDETAEGLTDWQGLCLWASLLNLWIIIINLIVPVYPLDGSSWTAQVIFRCMCKSARNAAIILVTLTIVFGLFFALVGLLTLDPLIIVTAGWCFYQVYRLIRSICDHTIGNHPLFNFDETSVMGRQVVIQTQLNLPPLGLPADKSVRPSSDLGVMNGDVTPTNHIVSFGRSPLPSARI